MKLLSPNNSRHREEAFLILSIMKISETFVPDEADVQKGSSHEQGSRHEDEATRRQQRCSSDLQQTSAQMLAVINFILQLPSAILGQFNSNPKPLYALILMSLSHTTLLLWIIELVQRFKMETVIWKWRGMVPLLYSSSQANNKPFFSFADIVGLLSTACQSIITTLNYALLVQHTNSNQIQISGWPIIIALVLLCSTFWDDGSKIDQPDHVPLHSIIIDKAGSEDKKIFTPFQDFKATRWRHLWCSQITTERTFVVINFILEVSSAVLDQFSSKPNPLYALILVLLSFTALLLCIIELVYKGRKGRVSWSQMWNGNKVPWLYPDKSLFSFEDRVGFICAMVQPTLATINYALVLRHSGQFQISVLPIVFALVLSCSKICNSPNKMIKCGAMFLKTDSEVIFTHPNLRWTVTKVSLPKTLTIKEMDWVALWEKTTDELKNILIKEGVVSTEHLEWEWEWDEHKKAEKTRILVKMFKSSAELKKTARLLRYIGIGAPNITLEKLLESSVIIEDRYWVEQVEKYLDVLEKTLKSLNEFKKFTKLKNPEDEPFKRCKIFLQRNVLYHTKEVMYLFIQKELNKLKKSSAIYETYWFLLAEHNKKSSAKKETYWVAEKPNLDELKKNISEIEETNWFLRGEEALDELKKKTVLQKKTLAELKKTVDELKKQNAFLEKLLDEAIKEEKKKESEERKEIKHMREPTGKKTVNVLRRRLRRL